MQLSLNLTEEAKVRVRVICGAFAVADIHLEVSMAPFVG